MCSKKEVVRSLRQAVIVQKEREGKIKEKKKKKRTKSGCQGVHRLDSVLIFQEFCV